MFDKIKSAVSGKSGEMGEFGQYGKYLEGLSFPASKEEVITHLQDKGADDRLIAHVESLTGNRFNDASEIFRGIMPH